MTENVTEMIESVEKVVNDKELSKKIIKQILNDFGGMQLYLPRVDSAFKEDNDRAIAEEFDGTNTKALCRKYNITFNTLYAVVRRERDRKSKERSKSLVRELDFN